MREGSALGRGGNALRRGGNAPRSGEIFLREEATCARVVGRDEGQLAHRSASPRSRTYGDVVDRPPPPPEQREPRPRAAACTAPHATATAF